MKSNQKSVLQKFTVITLLLAMFIQPFSVIAEEIINNNTEQTANQSVEQKTE